MNPPAASLTAGSLFSIRRTLIAKLPNNFDSQLLQAISSEILQTVSTNKEINSVVFDLSNITTIDRFDLNALHDVMKAVKLVGARIGLCSIGPGIAALIVNSGIHLPHQAAGHDIQDTMDLLH